MGTENGLSSLLNISRHILNISESNRIISLGRTPLWPIVLANFLSSDGIDFSYIAFSGSWQRAPGGNNLEIYLEKEKPTESQIQEYRKYLTEIEMDPRSICENEKNTKLLEYTQSGSGLYCFLEILKNWSVELDCLDQLKNKLSIIIFPHNEIHFNKNCLNGFCLNSRPEIGKDIFPLLANSDKFDDHIGTAYPFEQWDSIIPNQLDNLSDISENAILVLWSLYNYATE